MKPMKLLPEYSRREHNNLEDLLNQGTVEIVESK